MSNGVARRPASIRASQATNAIRHLAGQIGATALDRIARIEVRPARVLPRYSTPRGALTTAARRVTAMTMVWFFCLVYGAALCLFAPTFILPLLSPLGVLAALVIWSLPDTRRAPVGWLAPWFMVSAAAHLLWPNYLAVVLPGLPWITISRLVDTPLALVLLFCVSTSKAFRAEMRDMLNASRTILVCFIALEIFLIIGFFDSTKIFLSLDNLFQWQVSWAAMFFISIYVFSKPMMAFRWIAIIWISALSVSMLAIWEWRMHHVPWAGHLPSFLRSNNPALEGFMRGIYRGAAQYRSQGTFDGPIQMSEFMAMALIFIIHITTRTKLQPIRVAGLITIPIILGSQVLSGSRSGLIGSFLAPIMYALVWSVQTYQTKRTRLFGMMFLAAYPLFAIGALASSFVIPSLYHRLWVSTGTSYSDQDRVIQWRMGVPLIIKRPWGYGDARSAETLGFAPFGFISIDIYYLSLLLDIGIGGFLAWVGMFVSAAYQALTEGLKAEKQDSEVALLVPAAIALVDFMVIKTVFAETDNHWLFFAIIGMIVALTYRLRQSQPAAAAQPAAAGPARDRRERPILAA